MSMYILQKSIKISLTSLTEDNPLAGKTAGRGAHDIFSQEEARRIYWHQGEESHRSVIMDKMV